MKGVLMLYNVYAWKIGVGGVKRVAEGVDHSTAIGIIERYLNKGMDWDAWAVPQDEDFEDI